MPELIVHIGAGKTGSTAIQFSLRDAEPTLIAQNVAYLGLMLEKIEAAHAHDWCVTNQPQRFFQSRTPQQTDEQVYQVMRTELARLDAAGVKRAIWSNEAFMVQNKRILPILKRLAADGVKIRLVVYVRRHDKRARSSYVEFGIKSKRHKGDVLPFRDWLGMHSMTYADNLVPWQEAFPGQIEIYNFDSIPDIAAHFCTICGVEGVTSVRANESPSDVYLTAWAVYSGSKSDMTWANDFRRLALPLRLIGRDSQRPVPSLGELMPNEADIRVAQDMFRGDFDKMNDLLRAQSQPELDFTNADAPEVQVSQWEQDRMLLQMVFALQEQVLDLKGQIDTLKAGQDGT